VASGDAGVRKGDTGTVSTGGPPLPDHRITRRNLLQWLGQAATVPLWAPLVQACGSSGSPSDRHTSDQDLPDWPDPMGADGSRDAGGPGGDAGDLRPGDDSSIAGSDGPGPDVRSCEAEFQPGTEDLPILQSFPVRTVDPQDLQSILASWRLSVGGMVRREVTWSFCDLLAMGLVTQTTDFHCVEGWSVWDVPWDGVPLARLLDLAGPLPGASFLKIDCIGGRYSESLPLSVAREPRTLLALGIGGQTLPLSHGFPARVVVPRLLGYKNPKYVRRIDLVDVEHPGFWSRFGYPVSGEVPPERLREGHY